MIQALDVLWFRARQVVRALWFLPAIFCVVAILTVTAAYYAARFAPEELPFTVERGGVETILTILGSSMLTVSVFALSTMVSAVSRASEGTTPRAVPLIVQDRVSQSVISIFIGAFLFSIVGVLGLSSGIYSDAGRLVLFFVAMLVVGAVAAALIRWIGRISTIGRISETIRLAEKAASGALTGLSEAPFYACAPRSGPVTGQAVPAEQVGYVQHFDIPALAKVSDRMECTIHVMVRPGHFLGPDSPLALVEGDCSEDDAEDIRAAFGIGSERTFEYDPEFGVTVLAEIASKALSAAANDTGTAIDVIGAQVRVLAAARDGFAPNDEVHTHKRLTLAPPNTSSLLSHAFRPIIRDGTGKIEVVERLLTGLVILAGMPAYAEPARSMMDEVSARAEAALDFPADREALEDLRA